MATDPNTLTAAYEQLQIELRSATEDVARRQRELQGAQVHARALFKAVEALRGVLGIEEVNEPPISEPVLDEGEAGPIVDDDGLIPTDSGAGSQPVGRRNVRSGSLVVDAVRTGDGAPVHRDEVVAYFERQGLSSSMKNVRNAVNTALYRAVKRGHLLQITTDTFAVPQNSQPDLAAVESTTNEEGANHE